jgi:predicted amidophosphoribosyltransferase
VTDRGVANKTVTEHAPPSYTPSVDGNSVEKLSYCPDCGRGCKLEAKFCAECGRKQAILMNFL